MGQRWSRVARGISQWRRIAVTGAVVCALVVGTGALAGAAPADRDTAAEYHPPVVPTEPGPPQSDHLAASRYMKTHPNAAPQGANDFGCRPRADHPRPVVLAHGTDASAYSDWSVIAPQLARAGFCVFALNYGGKPGATSYGTEDLWLSARQVGEFVDRVLAATGARQVDLVGFSQGASVTRYYTNKLGGAAKVARWVGLASPTYGGVMFGLVPVANALPPLWDAFEKVTSRAAVQQAQGAPFMRELNAGGDTVAGVQYTTIGSRVDEMIQPFDNIALRGPGATNLVLQDLCPINLTGHFHMVYDPYVQQLLANVLDPEHAREPVCRFVPLGTGIPEVILGAHG
ncbi:esterase/lipase family protein [Nocardia transvalensis]|uniref:esterase/lipase family protein n=1 Tax=Nocardia transvalensis TaxID=37333 RepID=UPI0018951B45|nr:alpha/beta fold hydrolase [Nocardia transvalensis]MBF6332182.1 alpha/beta fold hydrolase [Nocardia transvalensis]